MDRVWTKLAVIGGAMVLWVGASWTVAADVAAAAEETRPAENVYRGEMAAFPGPWAFGLPKDSIILVSDQELETLASDPDKAIDLSLTPEHKRVASLRQFCEEL